MISALIAADNGAKAHRMRLRDALPGSALGSGDNFVLQLLGENYPFLSRFNQSPAERTKMDGIWLWKAGFTVARQ